MPNCLQRFCEDDDVIKINQGELSFYTCTSSIHCPSKPHWGIFNQFTNLRNNRGRDENYVRSYLGLRVLFLLASFCCWRQVWQDCCSTEEIGELFDHYDREWVLMVVELLIVNTEAEKSVLEQRRLVLPIWFGLHRLRLKIAILNPEALKLLYGRTSLGRHQVDRAQLSTSLILCLVLLIWTMCSSYIDKSCVSMSTHLLNYSEYDLEISILLCKSLTKHWEFFTFTLLCHFIRAYWFSVGLY